jgi:hypothetical protein
MTRARAMTAHDVEVRGAATPEELAAVLAALERHAAAAVADDRFERWRRERQRVVRDNR